WLLRRASLSGLNAATPEELIAAAASGAVIALETFERAGQILGQSIANLINLFNPTLIIISGEGVRAGEFMFTPMRRAISQHTFDHLDEGLEIRVEPLSDDTWARGAASLVLQEIFRFPDAEMVSVKV